MDTLVILSAIAFLFFIGMCATAIESFKAWRFRRWCVGMEKDFAKINRMLFELESADLPGHDHWEPQVREDGRIVVVAQSMKMLEFIGDHPHWVSDVEAEFNSHFYPQMGTAQ